MYLEAMDDIGVVMTPFGDVVTVILVVKVARGNDKNEFFRRPSSMALRAKAMNGIDRNLAYPLQLNTG